MGNGGIVNPPRNRKGESGSPLPKQTHPKFYPSRSKQNWNASRVLGCSSPALEEFMKPAIETPSGVSPNPCHKTVCCLRCEQRLDRYQLMRVSLTPGNSGLATLSCPRCGHVEFVSDSSPLLQSLDLVSVDVGDGD